MTRSFAVWLIIIGAETVNGIVREIFITPVAGVQLAKQISFGTAIVIITAITIFFVRWISAAQMSELFMVGFTWAALTFLFEVFAALVIAGGEWGHVLADLDPRKGGLMSFGMAFLVIVPSLVSHFLPTVRHDPHA